MRFNSFIWRKACETFCVYTVLVRDEVDVTVTEGPPCGRVSADANGSNALELRERLEELAVRHLRVQVADVERRRRRNNNRRRRHLTILSFTETVS